MVPPVPVCGFFFTRPSHPYHGEHAVYGHIYVYICVVIYILCVWAGPHLYIVLVELGDIKCMMTSPNGNIFRVAGMASQWGHKLPSLTCCNL